MKSSTFELDLIAGIKIFKPPQNLLTIPLTRNSEYPVLLVIFYATIS